MGCDETVGKFVVGALMNARGRAWVDDLGSKQPGPSERSAQTKGSFKPPAVKRSDVSRLTKPPDSRPTIERATTAAVAARLEAIRAAKDMVQIGNIGEQVALRVLARMGHEVIATQDDLLGGISQTVGHATQDKPEDFLVVLTPDNEFRTVNSKATISPRQSGFTPEGDLRSARVSNTQKTVDYTTKRAGFLSPLEGEAGGMIMKVDLIEQQAQLFRINDDGSQTPEDRAYDIRGDLAAVLTQFEGRVPAPSGPNIAI